jgi:uncharacterized membrane protein
MPNNKDSSGHHLEVVLGNLLRTGVILAFVVVLIGGSVYLLRHWHEVPRYEAFRSEPADLRSVGAIVRDVATLRGRSIIQFGILILILTPVARVAFSVFAFARQRDRTYVVVTLIVLSVLLYSLIGSQM